MRFSIIIPTYNRPVLLDRCLTAIAALNYPRDDFEVIVVDDGSDPEPGDVIARHTARLAPKYFRSHRRGPAWARNRGLREAQGEYVAFIDDDCAPEPEWLGAMDRAFARSPEAGLGGKIVNAAENGICGRTSQILITFLYEYGSLHPQWPRFFCSNNLAFPKKPLLEIGGFDENYGLSAGEDRDLCARWLEQRELLYVPDAVIRHRQNLNLRSFCVQHYRYGRGAHQFWLRRREIGDMRLRPASWRFYAGMLSTPFAHEPLPQAIAMTMLLGVSQVAGVLGYSYERNKVGPTAP